MFLPSAGSSANGSAASGTPLLLTSESIRFEKWFPLTDGGTLAAEDGSTWLRILSWLLNPLPDSSTVGSSTPVNCGAAPGSNT